MNIKYDVETTTTGNIRERILMDFLKSTHRNMQIDYSLSENGARNELTSRQASLEAEKAATTFKRIIKEKQMPLIASKRGPIIYIERKKGFGERREVSWEELSEFQKYHATEQYVELEAGQLECSFEEAAEKIAERCGFKKPIGEIGNNPFLRGCVSCKTFEIDTADEDYMCVIL